MVIPLRKAEPLRQKELEDDLPQTVLTPENTLLCIEKSGHGLIGYLWYKLFDNGATAFIYDFIIFEDFRGVGYGKTAVSILEQQLLQIGVEQIKLRVAFNNDRALGLYKKLNFNITGYNMVKILGK